ncbi:MAG: hypothetical protein O2999_08180 [Nitrospirae bacterium]|nr:hypothetical protein [Nitrospirota bacterium]MDA1304265.1 hypothetical protein [Nitrospirota bacterium]
MSTANGRLCLREPLRQCQGTPLAVFFNIPNTYPQCHFYTYHWARQIVRHRKQHANQFKSCKLTEESARLITQLGRQYLSYEQGRGYLK